MAAHESALSMSDLHAAQAEDRARIDGLEKNYERIDKKLDRLIFALFTASVSFVGSVLVWALSRS